MTKVVAWVDPEQTAPVGLRLVSCGLVSAVVPEREVGLPRARLALKNLLYGAFDPVLVASGTAAPDAAALQLGLKRVNGFCQISMVLSRTKPMAAPAEDNGRAYLHHARDQHASKARAASIVRRILGSLSEPIPTAAIHTQPIPGGYIAHMLTPRSASRRIMDALQRHSVLCLSDREDFDATITGPWPPSAVLWSPVNATV